jgi:antitoxin VapB
MFAPLYAFDQIDLAQANALLVRWGHKMGPLERGNVVGVHYALFEHGEPVAVAMAAPLIRECVGGGNQHLTRDNTIELARLCAARPGLCRVALRLWREGVFPAMRTPGGRPYTAAISYQDADLHSGNTYRFDGWVCIGRSSSGADRRSGRKGRNKRIWCWGPGCRRVAA